MAKGVVAQVPAVEGAEIHKAMPLLGLELLSLELDMFRRAEGG